MTLHPITASLNFAFNNNLAAVLAPPTEAAMNKFIAAENLAAVFAGKVGDSRRSRCGTGSKAGRERMISSAHCAPRSATRCGC